MNGNRQLGLKNLTDIHKIQLTRNTTSMQILRTIMVLESHLRPRQQSSIGFTMSQHPATSRLKLRVLNLNLDSQPIWTLSFAVVTMKAQQQIRATRSKILVHRRSRLVKVSHSGFNPSKSIHWLLKRFSSMVPARRQASLSNLIAALHSRKI